VFALEWPKQLEVRGVLVFAVDGGQTPWGMWLDSRLAESTKEAFGY
jgi:hypothetical protein